VKPTAEQRAQIIAALKPDPRTGVRPTITSVAQRLGLTRHEVREVARAAGDPPRKPGVSVGAVRGGGKIDLAKLRDMATARAPDGSPKHSLGDMARAFGVRKQAISQVIKRLNLR
jgi:hypothetical protein